VEICSGGRYDNLIGNFGAPEPAVGFSFSLDGLAGAISRQGPESRWQGAEITQTAEFNGDLAAVFSEARRLRMNKRKVKISGQ
jgi:ATP phosphoribosyltransferase regulatory subunit